VMKVWLDRGAAGWRMDVAPWVPDDFWREWRAAIKAHRPDAITIAETWFDSAKYFLGDSFDSTMNYIFRNALLEYAAGGDAALLYRNIESIREAYPPPAFHALMNLLSTHD
jgi:cyclomaltodextrinase